MKQYLSAFLLHSKNLVLLGLSTCSWEMRFYISLKEKKLLEYILPVTYYLEHITVYIWSFSWNMENVIN